MTRPRLSEIDGQAFDIAVIGAGAVGCSAAQHLSARGYRVVLLDQGDIASGTSSRSSRLLYCGLAYFASELPLWRFLLRPRDLFQRLRMARLAMRCRSELAETMPERVSHHTFFFPIFRDGAFPAWKVGLGYRLLSLFGSRHAPLGYRNETAEAARERYGLVARMDRDRLTSTAVFREYQYAWAERIVVDTALDARRLGCLLRSYTAVTDLRRDGDAGWRLSLNGTAPGEAGAAEVTARLVINAAGPWIDRLHARITNGARRRLVGIKGINLLVRLPEDCRGQGLETTSSHGDPFYLMPWGDHHFFGPTETIYDGDPADVRVEQQELDYVLGEANRVFPGLGLSEADVVYRWAGVRPRTVSDEASGVKALTIHDMASDGLPDLLAVTGCPIMMHRHAGRTIGAAVARRLRPSGRPSALSYAARLAPEAIRSDGGLSAAEIRYAAQSEEVVTLGDLMLRRLPVGWQPDMGLPEVRRICAEAGAALGWDEARQAREIEAYRDYVATHFAPTGKRGEPR